MTKQEPENRWTHKGWTVVLKIRPDGWLYCCWPPGGGVDDDFVFAADTLKEAKTYIEGNPCTN